MIGLAFSGGGITGIIGSLCALNSLMFLPSLNLKDIGFATSSGGTIGVGLHANAAFKMSVPRYSHGMSYEEANSQRTSADKPVWYGQVVNYLPSGKEQLLMAQRSNTSGWWTKIIDLMFWEGYGVHDYNITAGTVPWRPNFGLLLEHKCPIKRDPISGVLANASDALTMAMVDMLSMNASVPSGEALSVELSALEVMAYSSSFWVAGIVESEAKYILGKHTIRTATVGGDTAYITDGGIVDTTGIVAHLQARADRIVAFYNNNDDLTALNSSFAYLFGVATSTDSQNSLEGPELAQVFQSQWYESVILNLTNPAVLRARIQNVKVLGNSYLGVKDYTLSELIILSNQYSDQFLDSLDPSIKGNLSAHWPNTFPIGMPTLDANALCVFNDWKVQKYSNELFPAAPES